MRQILVNVHDRRHNWIGAWEIEPLDITKLTDLDIGRTVIYRSHNLAEAGTLTSWRDGIVFARYTSGNTSAGANAADVVFAIRRCDDDPYAAVQAHRPAVSRPKPRRDRTGNSQQRSSPLRS